jgi:hypothetical protein
MRGAALHRERDVVYAGRAGEIDVKAQVAAYEFLP